MKCSNCGANIDRYATYCPSCLNKINTQESNQEYIKKK